MANQDRWKIGEGELNKVKANRIRKDKIKSKVEKYGVGPTNMKGAKKRVVVQQTKHDEKAGLERTQKKAKLAEDLPKEPQKLSEGLPKEPQKLLEELPKELEEMLEDMPEQLNC